MSFSFNFAVQADGAAAATAPGPAHVAPAAQTDAQPMRAGERFVWTPGEAPASFSRVAVAVGEGESATSLAFELVNTTDASFLARTGAIRSLLTTSDLQTGVYEGGFKLWECAVDLVQFVEAALRHQGGKMPAAVLELGCGHGLPGIHALQRGAERVVFMDYNKEVLELTTCPNVLQNVHGDMKLYRKASFYAGAWSSVSDYMQRVEQQPPDDRLFDLILTAETIYTEAVALELYETIKRHLRRAPTARALVAAKKYYFGTGGSVQHFLGLVAADGIFHAQRVWEERDCRSNIREILELRYVV